jgi:thiamine-phosphate pyrophosphorylase
MAESCDALLVQISAAVEAGVDYVQIRERDLAPRVLADITARAVAAARGSRTRILVNDRADVALAAGADGVHLRTDGPPVVDARRLGVRLVSRAAHSIDDVRRAAGADLVIFGTVFESMSKAGVPAQGLRALATASSIGSVPLLAIGGVTIENAAGCRRAGAAGIAAIGLFLCSVEEGARELRRTWRLDS